MRLETRRGAKSPLAKFTAAEVTALRQQMQQTGHRSLRAYAQEHHVSAYTIFRIMHKISYQDEEEE